jgi:cellulose synthase/poly-beta-1,6-N-acetylglucosamine synthase-like glycosyltransferase
MSGFNATITSLTFIVPNALPYILRILAIKPAIREKQHLLGEDVPNVDVLITTCNEDLQVVMDTVKAACVLDYPIDRYRVFVCDDGASTQLRDAVETHASQFPHLHYTARTKGSIEDYKAGNLNHGLAHSASVDPLSFSWLPRL